MKLELRWQVNWERSTLKSIMRSSGQSHIDIAPYPRRWNLLFQNYWNSAFAGDPLADAKMEWGPIASSCWSSSGRVIASKSAFPLSCPSSRFRLRDPPAGSATGCAGGV